MEDTDFRNLKKLMLKGEAFFNPQGLMENVSVKSFKRNYHV